MAQPVSNLVDISENSSSWEASLQNVITDPKELLDLLEIDQSYLPAAIAASALFPLKVPREFATRMQKNNLNDPLLLQVLPLQAELLDTPGYSSDPLQESEFNPLPGLLHKYHGRVLLTLVGTCGINCRFCFRREFPYEKNNPGSAGWDNVLAYIANDPSIREVILSGGDPLVVPDKTLINFTKRLNDIPHVQRLRLHTRMPVVMPERITSSFIDWVKQLKQKCVMVLHCNHAQEMNDKVRHGLQRLTAAGVLLLNQTVLLKGVNDSVTDLVELSEALSHAGVQPYYLHLLDKVSGTAHFDIPIKKAKEIHSGLSQKLSGYLVPKLVYEQAGAPAKVQLTF